MKSKWGSIPKPIGGGRNVIQANAAAAATTTAAAATTRLAASPQQSFKRDPDQYMPIANVIRIMRRVLPDHAKIADDAKETIQECVSEFIGFVTSEANQRCHREYRKTVTPDDVISAMASLGFSTYVQPLSVFLDKHRGVHSQPQVYLGPPEMGGAYFVGNKGGGEGSSDPFVHQYYK
ncbi:nuclear transcription factor Y subunit B [Striga asiatica]|uniref:Nuclear transcription factor Y subunit B n=1 Tax=Striga asiatica TaxID=4170 RepID=A0A5A7PJK4_STRAF|nr:nuclear transcription factor Y subunit B [Striga asiatica]